MSLVLPDLLAGSILYPAFLKTIFPGRFANLHLFANNIIPTPATALGDFVEITGGDVPGYAHISVAPLSGAPWRLPGGDWEDLCGSFESFLATGPPPVPIVAYGWFLTDSTNAILTGSGAFSSPFTFSSTGDGFLLTGFASLSQLAGLVAIALPEFEPA